MLIRTLACVLVATSLSASASAGSPAELVVNGNFETGDFSGWTQWGDTGFSGVNDPYFDPGVAFFGPVNGFGGIYQDIATVVGEQYTFSFDLSMQDGTPNSFFANFGGLEVMSYTDSGGFGWTHYSFDVIASDATSQIKFGFYNSPAFMFLDNVSVTATPAPGALALLGAVGVVGARRRRA
jgi:MYXO-CTERM domain-containing protein